MVYLHGLTEGFKVEGVIGEWIGFYNTERPKSAPDGHTPAEASETETQQQKQDVIHRILAG